MTLVVWTTASCFELIKVTNDFGYGSVSFVCNCTPFKLITDATVPPARSRRQSASASPDGGL